MSEGQQRSHARRSRGRDGLAVVRLELVRRQDCVGFVEQRLDLSKVVKERDVRIDVNHLSRVGAKKPAKIGPVTACRARSGAPLMVGQAKPRILGQHV
jgi:hypothetical protein